MRLRLYKFLKDNQVQNNYGGYDRGVMMEANGVAGVAKTDSAAAPSAANNPPPNQAVPRTPANP